MSIYTFLKINKIITIKIFIDIKLKEFFFNNNFIQGDTYA